MLWSVLSYAYDHFVLPSRYLYYVAGSDFQQQIDVYINANRSRISMVYLQNISMREI